MYHRGDGYLINERDGAIGIFSHVTKKGVEHDKNLSVTDPFAQGDLDRGGKFYLGAYEWHKHPPPFPLQAKRKTQGQSTEDQAP